MQLTWVTDGHWHADADGEVMTFRPLDAADDESVCLRWHDMLDCVHPDDRDELAAGHEALIAGHPLTADFRARGPDDVDWRWLHIVGTASSNRERALKGLISDITALKNREMRAHQAVEHVNQFASAVAHDIQGPLRHIAIYAGILRSELGESVEPSHQEMLQIIESKGQDLQIFVRSVMALARGTRGPVIQPAALDEVLKKSVAGLQQEIEEHGAQVTVPAPTDAMVMADTSLLSTAITNLLSNGLHHRTSTGAKIALKVEQSDDRVKLYVTDDGPGLPANARPHIFDAYWSRPVGEKPRRLGMGLALAKTIMLTLDGDVELHATGDSGSTFLVDIPAA